MATLQYYCQDIPMDREAWQCTLSMEQKIKHYWACMYTISSLPSILEKTQWYIFRKITLLVIGECGFWFKVFWLKLSSFFSFFFFFFFFFLLLFTLLYLIFIFYFVLFSFLLLVNIFQLHWKFSIGDKYDK